MEERKYNSCFNNSLNNGNGFRSHLISDAGHGFTIRKPFDGFCHGERIFIGWEGKKISGFSSFNFNKIEPHQFLELVECKKNKHYGVIVLYVDIPRKSGLFLLDIDFIKHLIQEKDKKSLLKKELFNLYDRDFFIPKIKGMFDLTNFKSMIITEDIYYNE